MKCSKAIKLSMSQGLTPEQVEALREHARRCEKCAEEIEASLLALSLADEPRETPPLSFANAVMAQVQKAPAPGVLTREQRVAAIAFLFSAAGLALVLSVVQKKLLHSLSGGYAFELSIPSFEGLVDRLVRYAEIGLAVLVEWARQPFVLVGGNLLAGLFVALVLLVVLYLPKIKPVKAILL